MKIQKTKEEYTPRLWTIEDVAQYFSVSEITVRNWIAKDAIPRPIKINHRIYWHREDIIVPRFSRE